MKTDNPSRAPAPGDEARENWRASRTGTSKQVVLRCGEGGDAVAQAVLRQQGEELARLTRIVCGDWLAHAASLADP